MWSTMMLRRCLRLAILMRRRVLFIFMCAFIIAFIYLLYNKKDYDTVQRVRFRYRNTTVERMEGYLVWNPKCHMLSKEPLDPSIRHLIWKEEFQNCSMLPPLTRIARTRGGEFYLKISPEILERYDGPLSCCWAPVVRPDRSDDLDIKFDSQIIVGTCSDFEDQVAIPRGVETVHVTCSSNSDYWAQMLGAAAYENVHAVIWPEKVGAAQSQPGVKTNKARLARDRKLSVLMLGIDSVSRLSFYRTMPLTKTYLDRRNWFELQGYNKMGDNTFPNVMAVLTGKSEKQAFDDCKPSIPFGLDNCPFIWNDFGRAGYVTAYGEDSAFINTFNYLKVGFVKPPTDYYLRPYVLAYENLLKGSHRYFAKYCAGPELAFDRVFDYAASFAETFLKRPYFGLFWTSSISHENVNGPSAIDADFLEKLQRMEVAGVMDDAMLVLFSDHGMRYGDIRSSFLGWYEERLPFFFVSLPEWFRKQNPEAARALAGNRNRLTSPFDLYETLRDVLERAGGRAAPSSGCPKCLSLLKPIPWKRGCDDAGISSHWCTCDAFQLASTTDEIVVEGARRFVQHMEDAVKGYRDEMGARLCASPKLKKIKKVQQVVDLDRSPDASVLELLYSLEVTPGDGAFEVTIRYFGPGNYSISEEEVSRINSYAESSKCLEMGLKKYCHCV